MESGAIPAIFLHNSIAVVLTLFLSFLIRIRWLVSLIAWSITFGLSFLWKGIGIDWFLAWKRYFRELIFEGGLWHNTVTEKEIAGLLIFWLLPLALAYATALARIVRVKD